MRKGRYEDMKKIIKIIVTVGFIMVCAFLFGGMKVSAAEPSPEFETIVDMAQVTGFTANSGRLQLYFNDGTGYYWEKDMDAVVETGSDADITLDYDLVDMDTVVDFVVTEYGLQLYFINGSGYFLER